MLKPTRLFLVCSILTLCTLSLALGQEVRKDPSNKTPIITASVTADGVRIAAPSAVVQLRLEIYNDAGQKLLDTEQRGGNVLDWHLQGGAGERVADGTYLGVVTIKNPSGRLSQKLGLLTVTAQSTTIRSAGIADLSPRQAQVVGPIEGEDEGLEVLPAEGPQPVTVVAHTGDEAQLTRTRGALTFRVGDFFNGNDKEQMRLTEDGNLGLGTTKPRVKLDVAGVIRAREGFMFSDGSMLKLNERGVLTRTGADGLALNSVTTSQDRIAKFTDNAGTVGDSVITESAGNVGIGTSTPDSKFVVSSNTATLPPALGTARFADADGVQTTVFADSFGTNPIFNVRRANGTAAAPSALQTGQLIGVIGASGYGTSAYTGTRARVGFFASEPWTNTANGTYLTFNTTANGSATPGGTERMRVDNFGNVGIGTNNPSAKLEVAGNLKLSGANSGLTFPDGTSMTTAATGGTMSGTSIVNAVNDPATAGMINDNRLSPNVARLNSANTFNGNQTVNGAVQSTSGGFVFPDGSVQTGAAGQGFTKSTSTNLEISPGSGSEIISVDFPAGTYLLTASIQFENTANLLFQNNSRLVSCIFSHPISQNEPGWQVRLGAPGNQADQVPLTFTGVYTDTQPWHVSLFCQVLNGGIDRSYVLVKGRRLTAVRLGNLVTQP